MFHFLFRWYYILRDGYESFIDYRRRTSYDNRGSISGSRLVFPKRLEDSGYYSRRWFIRYFLYILGRDKK